MEITVSELAASIGGQLSLEGAGPVKISGAASLADALPGDVTFYGSPKYLGALRNTKASVVLVPQDFSESIAVPYIRCENPAHAFAEILAKIAPPPVVFPPGVHPTAIIGAGVQLGEGVSIQPYVIIEAGAQIGDRTVVGAHGYIGHGAKVGNDCFLAARVTLYERTVVGNRVILHSGVVLGADGFGFQVKNGEHVKVPQTGIVQVDDDVEIGANACVDRARFGRTWIKAGTKVDNLVQVGHNVVVGTHSVLCAQVGIAGSAVVGNSVTLGGQVGVSGHLEIGDEVTCGGQTGVTKSLPPKQTYFGTPAVRIQDFIEQQAHVKSLERLKRRIKALEQVLSERMKSLPPGS